MGDVRYEEVYDRLADAKDRSGLLATLTDEEVIAALAAASQRQDPLLANVLATEAQNRTARQRRLLAAMGEAVLVVKWPRFTIDSVNPAAERMFGYTAQELRGKSPALLHLDADQFASFAERVGEALRAGRVFRTSHLMRRRDGARFPTEHTVTPVPNRDGTTVGAISLVRDVSLRRRAERRLAAQNAVARVLAGASGFDSAVTAVLEAFCQSLDWELGEAWWVDPTDATLALEQTWEADPERTREFVQDSRKVRFARGEGLPGRIWESGRASGFLEVTREAAFVRRASARRLGFRAGFGLPVQSGGRTLGVLTFLSREVHEFDEELQQVMDGVGQQVGQFVVRAEAEEMAQAFLESTPDAAVVTDSEGRVVFWNSGAERLLGWPRDSLLATPVDRILTASAAKEFHLFRAAVCRGEEAPDIPAEFALRRADGTEFLGEITFGALRTRSGVLVASSVRDATARRALEARQAELAAIVESSADAVISVDRNANIVTWNPAATRLYGYSEVEALGQPITLIVPEDRRAEWAELWTRVRGGEPLRGLITERRARDGRIIPMAVSLSPVRDPRGRVVGVSSIGHPR